MVDFSKIGGVLKPQIYTSSTFYRSGHFEHHNFWHSDSTNITIHVVSSNSTYLITLRSKNLQIKDTCSIFGETLFESSNSTYIFDKEYDKIKDTCSYSLSKIYVEL